MKPREGKLEVFAHVRLEHREEAGAGAGAGVCLAATGAATGLKGGAGPA